MIQVLAEPRLDVEVSFLPVIHPEGRERRELADAAHQAVRAVVVSQAVTDTPERT